MENEEENEIPPEGLTLLLMLGILLGGTFLINFIVCNICFLLQCM